LTIERLSAVVPSGENKVVVQRARIRNAHRQLMREQSMCDADRGPFATFLGTMRNGEALV
jgi:hypothetical protein